MYKATDVTGPGFFDQPLETHWAAISPQYSVDESNLLEQLLMLAEPSPDENTRIEKDTADLIERVRNDKTAVQLIDALLLEYSLDTREGILLMCLAEALMRIPDTATADALIRDKLSVADWKSHLKNSDKLFVNASTWGLMLTGKVISLDEQQEGNAGSVLNRLVNKMSEPVIRKAMNQAMKIMGHQFVLGRTIHEALDKGRKPRQSGYTYSFDMLGEAALTREDAEKYFQDYLHAIEAVGKALQDGSGPAPSVSIKLSALHSRYEVFQEHRVMTEMYSTVLTLLKHAREKKVAITIDAEESDRLELSLKLFEKLYRHEEIKGWGELGLVVQAYSKRALPVLAWLTALAKEQGDRIPVRLVKGAYWDSEIKLAQQRGQESYPVFTRKEGTDVSYLACARFLLSQPVRGYLYPQFASHNAHTISAVSSMASHGDFEFQRLHGMGEALYSHVREKHGCDVRIYAPVGSHKDLLPYLVRRLLENGANSSFVHRLVDARCPVSELTEHPSVTLKSHAHFHNDRIPLPGDIFGNLRRNSWGLPLAIDSQRVPLSEAVNLFMGDHRWHAMPLVNGEKSVGKTHLVTCPHSRSTAIGAVDWADTKTVEKALDGATSALPAWQKLTVRERGHFLLSLADRLESHTPELVALCHREAGKTIQDAVDEVREAVDFLRYYPQQGNSRFGSEQVFTSFRGEKMRIQHEGLGVVVCISPWNFPLAIFIGQVAAALIAGNTVIAKAAEQTSLIAFRAIEMLLETGIPPGVIQFVPGDGASVGAAVISDERVAGVAFTGSTPTAQHISRVLAGRRGGTAPLIAETGGQNAMLVDSTALPEQVVRDVIRSAFASAGQRCSALRVLFVQQDVADRIIPLIKGAMSELSVGSPEMLSTDVGPVIDEKARMKLAAHVEHMKKQGRLVYEVKLGENCADGDFIAPVAFEIDDINQLETENFGPVLHIVRYKADELDKVIDQINATGYGLTLGVHSRNETTYLHIEKRARVGNCYINRDQVGAVVGVQPFGGQGLSGTGPKAGGPHYLYRFTKPTVVSH
ncbi:bifunctional proline dehydrogenase/L-glutamate gamma-semialdehyde dehydrogenase PutA [Parasalinivibrio latis]|uniref:bifunctional proline dehydrogenase/L-glutamate gamma-semialdehyde dehydrogenase PutA n=1 Tax=Parasalinivibrio latis TaxID=2952610 RepID=UPI0030DDFF55